MFHFCPFQNQYYFRRRNEEAFKVDQREEQETDDGEGVEEKKSKEKVQNRDGGRQKGGTGTYNCIGQLSSQSPIHAFKKISYSKRVNPSLCGGGGGGRAVLSK